MRKPAYWAVLPAKVRYDGRLRPNAKLLYAEITALAGTAGYCWATNEYLAQLFEIKPRTVSDLIGTLAQLGYIRVEVLRDEKNAVTERRLWVELNPGEGLPPIAKNCYRGMAKNCVTPIAKNGAENNIKNMNNIPPIVPQGGRRARKPKAAPDWKPERFAKFWDFYSHQVRGESKQAAIRAWDRLQPDDTMIDQIGRALLVQIKSADWQQGVGVPYASTYLNNQRWTDVPAAPKPVQPPPGGWADDKEVL